MRSKLSSWLAISWWVVLILIISTHQVDASTPLTRAEVQKLRNFVQLLQKNTRSKRPAKVSDAIIPGDGLSTGRASLADLRFNDGSLARVGEQAIFQFLPRTRNFRLSNGTVLLLIPPGRGQTRIQTPSAVAAIRGSALFVRYDQQTDTTVIGALTNSGIIVSNKEASQTQELQAGQLLVLVKGRFQALYDFDLQNFYQTSDLVQGLNLTRKDITTSADPAIASVKAEIATALAEQIPLTGQDIIENPSFLELTARSSLENTSANLTADLNSSSLESFFDTGEFLFKNAQESVNREDRISTPENNLPSVPAQKPIDPPSSTVNQPPENIGNPGNDKPVGNAGENPSGKENNPPIETPMDKGNNSPIDNPGDKQTNPPIETPSDSGNNPPPAPIETPIETPSDSGNNPPPAPIETPIETPSDSGNNPPPAPIETPIETPSDSGNNPPPAPIETPIETPSDSDNEPIINQPPPDLVGS